MSQPVKTFDALILDVQPAREAFERLLTELVKRLIDLRQFPFLPDE
jgi:hypothetical protein